MSLVLSYGERVDSKDQMTHSTHTWKREEDLKDNQSNSRHEQEQVFEEEDLEDLVDQKQKSLPILKEGKKTMEEEEVEVLTLTDDFPDLVLRSLLRDNFGGRNWDLREKDLQENLNTLKDASHSWMDQEKSEHTFLEEQLDDCIPGQESWEGWKKELQEEEVVLTEGYSDTQSGIQSHLRVTDNQPLKGQDPFIKLQSIVLPLLLS